MQDYRDWDWYRAGGFPPGAFQLSHRGCSCSCAGCRGVHGGVDHCRVSWLGCNI